MKNKEIIKQNIDVIAEVEVQLQQRELPRTLEAHMELYKEYNNRSDCLHVKDVLFWAKKHTKIKVMINPVNKHHVEKYFREETNRVNEDCYLNRTILTIGLIKAGFEYKISKDGAVKWNLGKFIA